MAAPVLQFKRGAYSSLPGLKPGEPAFTTDLFDLYVGLDTSTNNNKFFGSHRYWTRETTSTGSGVNLVEGTSTGSNYVTISAPASVGAAVTYYFPASQGATSSVLTNDGSGNLSWSSGSDNAVFSGITTFSDTTNNTLGNSNTGSVLFDGGVGIDKNLTIGGNLNVQGYSEFVGVVTFRGGTINIGDSDTDDVIIGGEFASDLVPTTDDTYSLGSSSKQWKDLYLNGTADIDALTISGVSTFTGLVDANGGLDVSSGATLNELSVTGVSTFGNSLDINSSVDILTNLSVSGLSTFSGLIDSNGGLNVTGQTTLNDNLEVTGVSTFANNLTVGPSLSTFQNEVTFNGNLNFGNQNTDLITITSRFNSDLIPVTDSTSDLGTTSLRWAEVWADNVTVDNIQIGVSSTGEIDTDSGRLYLDSADGQVVVDDHLFVVGVSTFANPIFANNGATIIGAETTLSSATVQDLTTGRIVLAGTGGSLEDNANLRYTSDEGLTVGTGGANIIGVSTFSSNLIVGGDLRLNGNDIIASDGSVNITLTDNTLTTFAGDIQVGGNDIKASDGTTAITLSATTGNVGVSSDLTVSGNLFVNGSTTQVNTTSLTVEDSLIEIGLIGGNAPGSDLNKDLGIILNYYTGSAKKAAVYWDDSVSRIVLADDISESSSVLTAAAYAALEIGSLWINDCAGQSQVISCTGSERFLENITIDGGSF
jgi:hypothetical protein